MQKNETLQHYIKAATVYYLEQGVNKHNIQPSVIASNERKKLEQIEAFELGSSSYHLKRPMPTTEINN